MAEGSTAKAGKRGKRSERGKKVEEEKQERLALEVGHNVRKVTFAKEIGVKDIDVRVNRRG